MNRQGIAPILIIIVVVIILGIGGYYFATKKAEAPIISQNQQSKETTPLATQLLSDEQTLAIVKETVIKDLRVSTKIECLTFLQDKDSKFITYMVTRKFNSNCLGDPTSSPAIPRLRVNLTDGKVFVESLDGEFRPINITNQVSPAANWKTYTNYKYGFSLQHPLELNFMPLSTFFVSLSDGVESDVPSSYNLPNSFQRSQKIYAGIISASTKLQCIPEPSSQINVTGIIFNKYQIKGDCAMDGCSIGNTYTTWRNSICYEFAWFAIQSSYAKYYDTHSSDSYNDPGYLAAQKAAGQTTENITSLAEKILSTFKFTK